MSFEQLSADPGFESYPLGQPPEGVLPDPKNRQSRGDEVYITAGICLSLILFFAGLRLYAKLKILRARTKDDYAYPIAVVAGVAYISVLVALIYNGFYGYHQWDVVVGDLTVPNLRLTLVIQTLYSPVIWLIKLPLFLMFLQIFGALRWLRILTWLGIAITGLFYLSTMVSFPALCTPTTGNTKLDWLEGSRNPRCSNATLGLVQAGANIVSDFYILILPMPAVWSLQVSTRRKIGISAVVLTGLAACACSIVGMILRFQLVPVDKADTFWNVIPVLNLVCFEMTCGLIIPCTPSILAIHRHVFPVLASTLASYRRKYFSTRPSSSEGFDTSNSTVELQLESQGSYVMLGDPHARVPRLSLPAISQQQKTWANPSPQSMLGVHRTREFAITSTSP